MTVKDVIEALQKYDPTTRVVVHNEEYLLFHEVGVVEPVAVCLDQPDTVAQSYDAPEIVVCLAPISLDDFWTIYEHNDQGVITGCN